MSGGGGNSCSGGFRPPVGPVVTCENLNITISILKPDFTVFDIENLDNIELLMCEEDNALVFKYNNKVIGYGANSYINKILECLQQGFRYKAVIISFQWDEFIRVKVKA